MRPTKDAYFLAIAKVVASRSTCTRRAVGCVLVDARGRILATGYNGVAAGAPHCNEGHPCHGATAPSGTALDACQAIHAEQNALTQCRNVDAVHTAYVTVSPCCSCTKLLLSTGCARVVFAERYAQDETAAALWRGTNYAGVPRTWELDHA
jgi:dCMP deaminase